MILQITKAFISIGIIKNIKGSLLTHSKCFSQERHYSCKFHLQKCFIDERILNHDLPPFLNQTSFYFLRNPEQSAADNPEFHPQYILYFAYAE